MLSGATVGTLRWLGLGPFAPVEEAPKVAAPAPEEPARFVAMDPLIVSLLKGDGVAASIQMQVQLETFGSENATLIRSQMPRINDRFVREMHAYIPRLLRKAERLDVFAVKQRLQYVADKLMGKGIITDVLIESINEQHN